MFVALLYFNICHDKYNKITNYGYFPALMSCIFSIHIGKSDEKESFFKFPS